MKLRDAVFCLLIAPLFFVFMLLVVVDNFTSPKGEQFFGVHDEMEGVYVDTEEN